MTKFQDLNVSVRKLVLFLILSMGTLLTYYNVDKYIENGEQLIANSEFTDGLQGWQADHPPTGSVTVRPGLVQLQSTEAHSSVRLSQRLDPAKLGKRVVLKGMLKTIGIEGGTQGWNKGRVVFVQYIDGKAIYSTPHALVSLDGTHDWAHYSAVMPILSGASDVLVAIQLNHCVGEIQSTALSLFQVEPNPVYPGARWVVIGCWAIFIGWVFWSTLLSVGAKKIRMVLISIVCIAIILGITVPGAIKNEAKHELLDQAHTYASQMVEYSAPSITPLVQQLKAKKWPHIDITKIAHFLLFALLGGLLYVPQSYVSLRGTFIDAGLLACATEFLQLFMEDRGALIGDVVIDLAGVACAVLVKHYVAGWSKASAKPI
ncbi:MAG: VanZ family protein [Desulfobulbaceae bacterium]|nr:VanZ family protein [Desulfobulbaceae bacterium]